MYLIQRTFARILSLRTPSLVYVRKLQGKWYPDIRQREFLFHQSLRTYLFTLDKTPTKYFCIRSKTRRLLPLLSLWNFFNLVCSESYRIEPDGSPFWYKLANKIVEMVVSRQKQEAVRNFFAKTVDSKQIRHFNAMLFPV